MEYPNFIWDSVRGSDWPMKNFRKVNLKEIPKEQDIILIIT